MRTEGQRLNSSAVDGHSENQEEFAFAISISGYCRGFSGCERLWLLLRRRRRAGGGFRFARRKGCRKPDEGLFEPVAHAREDLSAGFAQALFRGLGESVDHRLGALPERGGGREQP